MLPTILLAMLLSACAATSGGPGKENVANRAQARWDALLAQDYEGAYSYLSPGIRSTMSATDFELDFRLRRVQYLSAEYREHSCDEDVCTVKIQLGYRIVRPLAALPEWESKIVVEEQWIKSAGKWWYLPE